MQLLLCVNILSGSEDTVINSFQSDLAILIISLIGGSIGGLISHFLQRSLQHKAWLFENRIDTFADFLKTLEQCRAKTSEYLGNPKNERTVIVVSNRKLIREVWEIYEPAIAHLAVVRLLLKEKHRENFEIIVNDHCCWQCISKPEKPDEIRHNLTILRTEIQEILEAHLIYSPLLNKIKRFFYFIIHPKILIANVLRKNLRETRQVPTK